MANGTIEPGTTSTISDSLAPTDLLYIRGGIAGGPGGGTGLIESSISNAGTIYLRSGQPGTPAAAPGTGAQLRVSGTLDTTGTLGIAGGPGSTNPLDAGGGGATLTNTGLLTLSNRGTLLVAGGLGGGNATYSGLGGGGGLLENSGSLSNDFQLTIGGGQGGVGAASGGGAGGTLDNTGTLTNTNAITISGGIGAKGDHAIGGTGGELKDDGVLVNVGQIYVDGGEGGHGLPGSGGAGSAGVLAVGGSLDNQGYITIAHGTVGSSATPTSVVPGGLLSVTGTLTNSGIVEIQSTGTTYTGVGGQIIVSGLLVDTGVIEIGIPFAPAPRGGGTLEVQQGGTVEVQSGGTVLSLGTIINNGLFAISQGKVASQGQIANGGVMQLGSEAQLGNSGTFSNTGALQLTDSRIGGDGYITNSGLITGTGFLGADSFTNDGTVSVSSGRLVINPVSGTTGEGQFAVGAGGTLAFTGAIASGETVTLGAADARLQVSAQAAGVLVVSPLSGEMRVLGGGTAVLNAADSSLVVRLTDATNLTLSQMTFVGGIGSSGNDQITALSQDQFLTGGLGTDTLTGSAATGDLFRDNAAGLNGDTIVNFAGTDAIDIVDIAPGTGLSLGYHQNGASGTLAVANGGTSTNITLAGTFDTSSFRTSGDGHGGTLIQLNGPTT